MTGEADKNKGLNELLKRLAAWFTMPYILSAASSSFINVNNMSHAIAKADSGATLNFLKQAYRKLMSNITNLIIVQKALFQIIKQVKQVAKVYFRFLLC